MGVASDPAARRERVRTTCAVVASAALALAGCGSSAHRSNHGRELSGTTPTTPAPAAQRISDFGADVSEVFLGRNLQAAGVDRELAAAAATGLGLARAAPLWEFTEPTPPHDGRHVYDWRFDDFISRSLAAYGFKWIAVLAYSPGWASLTPTELHGAPRSTADFAAYAGALAARYRGQIAAYEIWNEENSPTFWRPAPDPASYARLYQAARAAIHAVDPGVPVLVGGLANGTSFLADLLAIPGFTSQVDGIAVHPYGTNPRQVIDRVRDYRLELRSMGAADVPLYVTEYGWSTEPAGNPTYAPATEQGPFIGEVAQTLLRSDCDVRDVIFYAWMTAQRDRTDRDQWYGVASATAAATDATEVVARTARSLLAGGAAVRLCG